jgi:hypothetical protein
MTDAEFIFSHFHHPISKTIIKTSEFNLSVYKKVLRAYVNIQIPNPDKPEQIATKAPRHKAKPLVNIHLCVFVSWWRKCFATKCKEFTTKTLITLSPAGDDSI